MQTKTENFISFDRSQTTASTAIRPDRYRQLRALPKGNRYSVRGAGLSYAPLSFGNGSTVIDLQRFSRILAFDSENYTIEVEAGISLGTLYEFLTPRGLCLPVQPGYPGITVGGCISCDVHGKNQFAEGIFCDQVKALKLFHPVFGVIDCSRETQPAIFELTRGGFGLTGVIVSAVLALKPLPSTQLEIRRVPARDLEETFSLLSDFQAEDDLLYTWNNLSTRQEPIGKGFVIRGKFLRNAPDPGTESRWCFPLAAKTNPLLRVGVFGRATNPLINWGYHRLSTRPSAMVGRSSYYDFCYPAAKQAYYYSLYGRQGFLEQQLLIPTKNLKRYLSDFSSIYLKFRPVIALTSCKAFRGTARFLRYNGTGVSFSIDLPHTELALRFLSALDELNVQNGCISNLSKDSRITKTIVQRQYTEFDQFKDALEQYDPHRSFVSHLSERLEL